MEGFVQYVQSSLSEGSLLTILLMFGTGLAMSFNPCMGVMLPFVLGGNRRSGVGRSFMFIGGFTVTLMLMGLAAALFGKVLTFPGWFWIFFLGILYLIAGFLLLGIKFPISITGFQMVKDSPLWLRALGNRDGLNPGALGTVLALAPSPCTVPVIMAVGAYALASGQLLFGSLALGFYGLGHSLPLALAFLPWVRKLFRPNRFSRMLRSALGVILILLAGYLLIFKPDIFNHSFMTM